ncbi:hypothetical protein CLPUN_15500 [Clostridium puniceum]|uniref:Uncharacterized protein n=1 Tax=Clostridium puniceum TaxID=29367 RepID=A0A1S8TPT6_9CLOT|nr:hypothetical protein [Clostridium puniceum]OOM79602.1 hypothetical protein CLPUN_15500 [Clostridium puniceum]
MKRINIIEFLKIYLLTLILIGMAFICSNSTTVVDRENRVTVKTGTDFEPYYYLEGERS